MSFDPNPVRVGGSERPAYFVPGKQEPVGLRARAGLPTYFNMSLSVGQGAIFGGVDDKLVQRQRPSRQPLSKRR